MIVRTVKAGVLLCALCVTQVLHLAAPSGAGETPKCFGERPTIIRRPGQDVLRGTPGDDVILVARGRNTRVKGLGGDDRICDRANLVFVVAGAGDDRISAGDDNDQIHGGTGNDFIKAGTNGSNGDRASGGRGSDIVDGGPGPNDYVLGRQGADTIRGATRAYGGSGNDRIFGAGDTIAVYKEATGGVVVNLTRGTATGQGSDEFPTGGITGVIGSPYADKIVGDDADSNFLSGYAGPDLVKGRGGSDEMVGRSGDDRLEGGTGIDMARGDAGTDECEAEQQEECEIVLPPASLVLSPSVLR